MENTRFRGEEREGGQPASLIHSIETIGHFFIVIITIHYLLCTTLTVIVVIYCLH